MNIDQEQWDKNNGTKQVANDGDKNSDEEDEEDEDTDDVAPIMPPDGGFGWVIVIVGFMGGVIVDGIIFSFGIVYSEILLAFDSGKSQAAWVGSVMAGMYLTVGPIVSALANRYGCRLMCIIGAIIASIGLFLSVFAQSVDYLIFTYGILGGIGFGFIYLPCIVMVQFYFDKRRAFATGISVCGSGMGAFIFAPLSTLFINHYGWRGNMLLQSAIVLNMVALGGLLRPPGEAQHLKKKTKPLLLRIKEARDATLYKSDSTQSLKTEMINKDNSLILDSLKQSQNALSYNTIIDGLDMKDKSHRYVRSIPTLTIEETAEDDDDEEGHDLYEHSSCTPLTGTPVQCTILAPVDVDSEKETQRSMSIVEGKPSPLLPPYHWRRKSLPVNIDELKRPFYRQDIFFSGSLLRIPQFSSQPSLQHYHSSVLSLPKENLDSSAGTSCFKSLLCPQMMRHTISTMLDFSLLRSVTFMVLCAASFITMMGFFIPFVYLADYARTVGISKEDAGFLFSIIGVANTLGRVFSGWVSDRPRVNALLITNVALTTGGLATAFVPLLTRYDLLLAYSAVFGLAIACFASLRSIILVELLGLEKLTNAFGLLLLFQGVASIIGSPMAGFFYDVTKSYNTSFTIAGSLIAISGILGFPLPYISKWENHKKAKCDANQNGGPNHEKLYGSVSNDQIA